MNPDPFEQLSENEKEELSLCGITSFEQLMATDIPRICAELKQARQFFPARTFTLTEEKLQIFLTECASKQKAGESAARHILDDVPRKGTSLPTSGLHQMRTDDDADSDEFSRMNRHQSVLHSPVRSNHPWIAVFAALSNILLMVPALTIIALPWYLYSVEKIQMNQLELIAALVILPCVPYLIYARLATCPVCHMRIFRYHHYTRNRAAHCWPLLGYNLSTALHLIFRAFYVCPACGTPVKLLGSKGRRYHR